RQYRRLQALDGLAFIHVYLSGVDCRAPCKVSTLPIRETASRLGPIPPGRLRRQQPASSAYSPRNRSVQVCSPKSASTVSIALGGGALSASVSAACEPTGTTAEVSSGITPTRVP